MIADMGLENAVKADKGLADGLNIYAGKVTNRNVASALGREYVPSLDAVR